jgi:hypothetical protein
VRALFLCVVGWAVVASTSPAQAAAPPSVVISPHFQVFPELDSPADPAKLSRAFYQGATDFARRHADRIYLVTRSDLKQAVRTARGFDYRLKNAELATKLGIDNYKKIEVEQAATYLESALGIYQELHYGLVDPERVAEVALYLALSYIEQDNTTLKLFDRLQTMTELDPSRRIRPGYYPDEVVRMYRSARESLIALLREEGPQTSEAEALATFADTDFSVYGYAWPTKRGTYEVTLYLYSRPEGRFLKPETLEVATLDAGAFRAAGNRLMSRFLPRVLTPVERREATVVQSDGASPFSLEFGFAYASFWQFPYDDRARTRPWGNYGLSVAGRLMLTRDFAVVVGGHILNSLRDYGGFLFDDFSTLRGFFGGDMGVDLGDFNLGIQLGLETTTLGDFDACPDVSALCAERVDRSRTVRIDDYDLLIGINARPRVYWHAYRQFSLVASASASYYFIPLSGREFNFPITGQLGVSYRF